MADTLTWLDQLQPASFNGVEFRVDTIDVSGGDNVIVREYPFQDLPTVFRMSAATEEIKFSAYVIGDDYHLQRENLRNALTGSGLLVHPTAGAMRASVAGKYRIVESPTTEGGMARFDLAFVRADARRYPVAVASTAEQAKAAASTAKAAATDDFEARFSLAGAPGWVSDQVIGRLKSALDVAWPGIQSATAGLSDFSNQAIGSYQVLRSGVDDLVSTPRQLANQVGLLFALPTDLSKVASAGFQDAFSGVFDIGSKVPQTDFVQRVVPSSPSPTNPVMAGLGKPSALTVDSPARRMVADQNACVDNLISTMATAAYVETLAATELDSYEQALALRARVYDQCVGLMKAMSARPAPRRSPASSWQDAMAALLSACLADLQARSGDMTRLMTWVPDGWMPIWTASYRIYGTTRWADEIMAMNPHVTHPLLVPPGKPLRVVRHA